MKSIIILFSLSLSMLANNLTQLIDQAHNNELVQVYKSKITSADHSYKASKSAYLPKISIGASGSFFSPVDSMGAGQVYNAYAQASLVLLDGFKRENLLDEQKTIKKSRQYDLSQVKKEISLQVSSLYFKMQITQADIKSLEQSKKQLQEQLKQQQKFFEAKLTTEDNVARIEAAVANTEYKIEETKYLYDEYTALLQTLTNQQITTLQVQQIKEPLEVQARQMDSLKSLKSQADSIAFKAQQMDSSNYPTIVLSDKYSFSKYEDDNLNFPGVKRLDTQNVLALSLSMNLFDFGSASKQKQAILSEQNALLSQIAYKTKEVNAALELSLRAIDRSKKLLYASELSQDASVRTFEIVEKKYKARVVDYVKYLDALSNKIEAQAQYNRAQGTLQISYAQYYYNAGLDIKEYIHD